MATVQHWIEGARPRTLPAAAAPVIIGTGAAYAVEQGILVFGLLALMVALFLQIGVNYANDYSDGIRGTDATEHRVGPVRLVGQGYAAPVTVKSVAFLCFGIAALFGLALLAFADTLWMLLLGAAAIVAAWYYTGGKRPYGYAGLGELMVFVFFGLVATLGTTYTQALYVTPASVAGAIGVGSLSCALLMINNLRDIPSDTRAGKNTLAVRLGDRRARLAYVALIAVPALCVAVAGFFHPGAWLTLLTFVYIAPAIRSVFSGATGSRLIAVLGRTGRFTLLYGVVLAVGMAVLRLPVVG